METLFQQLKSRLENALAPLVPQGSVLDPQLTLATDKKFGDYQSNVAMGLAKKMGKPPRDVAQQIVASLNVKDLCERVEIAGPGFMNFFIRPQSFIQYLEGMKTDPRLGVETVSVSTHHVIDFSCPNLAKEMHVGHLRTTITGEVIARVIEFMGHTIDRINHVGDWGTQFGMLLQHIYENRPDVVTHPDNFQVNDLEVLYKQAKKRFDEDEKFASMARQKVVLLQSGDATALKVWRAFLRESLDHCHKIYALLDVTLKDVGESFYNNQLPGIVDELLQKGLAVRDQGAVCVFVDGYKNREGDTLPMIIQKSDGGYNYDTTDLAALKYRINTQHARRLIYVTDLRQSQHFDMLFAVARRAGWVDDTVDLKHIGYGMVLGQDRKPFKTRDGGTVRLKDLIEESLTRARAMVKQNRRGNEDSTQAKFQPDEEEKIAHAVGLAAIKYADLSHNLASDYVFDWNTMLAMDGNTGPYMLYAVARMMSIGRKAGLNLELVNPRWKLVPKEPVEIDLIKVLTRFGDVLNLVYETLRPNVLTDYLYDVSKAFSSFYDRKTGVSVLEASSEELKQSRLLLCALTARTLKVGLNLLSIQVVDAM